MALSKYYGFDRLYALKPKNSIAGINSQLVKNEKLLCQSILFSYNHTSPQTEDIHSL